MSKEEEPVTIGALIVATLIFVLIYIPVWLMEYYSPENEMFYNIALGLNVLMFILNVIGYSVTFAIPKLRMNKPGRVTFMQQVSASIAWALNGYLLTHELYAIPVLSAVSCILFGTCRSIHYKISKGNRCTE